MQGVFLSRLAGPLEINQTNVAEQLCTVRPMRRTNSVQPRPPAEQSDMFVMENSNPLCFFPSGPIPVPLKLIIGQARLQTRSSKQDSHWFPGVLLFQVCEATDLCATLVPIIESCGQTHQARGFPVSPAGLAMNV